MHEFSDIRRHADYDISHDIGAHHIVFPRCHACQQVGTPRFDICAAVLGGVLRRDLDRHRVYVIRAAIGSAQL